ncbi:hypothetical protein [Sinosporangium album]|uniref:hypothetical protein n=1 Tax=Sinosporangium album TaxID=504805 RepID=UPI001FE11C20|nr:hypothetical protein [Sinosporangium album]
MADAGAAAEASSTVDAFPPAVVDTPAVVDNAAAVDGTAAIKASTERGVAAAGPSSSAGRGGGRFLTAVASTSM